MTEQPCSLQPALLQGCELCGERAPPGRRQRAGWGFVPLGKEGCRRKKRHGLKPVISEEKLLPRSFPQRTMRGNKGSPHFCRIKQGQSLASVPQLPPPKATQQHAITYPHAVPCPSHVTPATALSAVCLPGTLYWSSVFAQKLIPSLDSCIIPPGNSNTLVQASPTHGHCCGLADQGKPVTATGALLAPASVLPKSQAIGSTATEHQD